MRDKLGMKYKGNIRSAWICYKSKSLKNTKY